MKIKRLLSVLLCLTLFVVPSLNCFAASEMVTADNRNYFSKEEREIIIDHNIRKYVNGANKGCNYEVAGDLVELYDTSGELFAYYVPIADGEKEGYMVTGALKDGLGYYCHQEEKTYSDLIESLTNDEYLVFTPPFGIVKQSVGTVVETRGIQSTDTNIYDLMRSEENERYNMNTLLQVAPRSEAYVSGQLSRYSNFLLMNNGAYYGGDQGWFQNAYARETGCGVVAIANILAYMALYKTGYSNLYSGSLNKTNFTAHMERVYQRTGSPIPDITMFKSRLISTAAYMGSNLSMTSYTYIANITTTVGRICSALNADKPVAILLYANNQLQDYDWHWMTITYAVRYDDGSGTMAVSTWGEKVWLNLSSVLSSPSLFSGIAYVS